MRNLRFVRYCVVLLDLVVLRTKAQNGFCPMCTKGCCIVLTRSKPFWGQFWGQIGETDSYPHRSNKCATLVPLRNVDTNISGFTQVKNSKNQYISFILQQEVVTQTNSTPSPHTVPVAARNASVWARSQRVGAVLVRPYTAPKFPLSGNLLFYRKGIYLNGISLYR